MTPKLISESDLVVQCQGCQHIWVVPVALPMDLRAFIKMLRLASKTCPQCGMRGDLRRSLKTIMLLTDKARRDAVAKLQQEAEYADPSGL